MKVCWERVIRFVSDNGRILKGEPLLPSDEYQLGRESEPKNLRARVIVGDDIFSESGACHVSDETVSVKRLLSPLAAEEVPILRCVGLNYVKHIHEVPGRSAPPYPSIFFKPNTTINDPEGVVVIPKMCQDDQADYEGEICIVIGKDAKDVSVEDAANYIAGYTCGNDVSSRKHQRDPKFAGSIPQWGFSKGFDGYAPIGPCIVSSAVIPDPAALQLKTIVDGEVRQDTSVSDLLFNCAYLVSYLSSGTTLQKGSIIMTGTPGGVGASFVPPRYLKPGTMMEVEISSIGVLRNRVEYA